MTAYALGPYSAGIGESLIGSLLVTSLYCLVVKIAHIYARPIARIHGGNGGQTQESTASIGYTTRRIPLSVERVRRLSVHEAGHLLAISLYGEEPKKLSAFVNEYQARNLGSVDYEFDDDIACTKKAQQVRMQVNLAGAIAEELEFGNCIAGSQQDNEQWERNARNYLAAFPGDREWFMDASSVAEATLNGRTLQRLKLEHIHAVTYFLKNNIHLLQEASRVLEERKKMEGSELISIVNRANLSLCPPLARQ